MVFTEEALENISQETQTLVQKLEEAKTLGRKAGAARKNTQTIFDSEVQVDSWKFNEWDYGGKCYLPSQARGLFTRLNPRTNKYEIVVRGYDKFFNVGENQSMSRESLFNNIHGPFTLTTKSNGCIVLISALEDGTLVVCSKHSTGPRNVEGADKNHAEEAQKTLYKQLERKNIDPKELATTLYNLRCTGVAEFCDDSFEEHVLEYKEDQAGLYFHGLNFNTPHFKTHSMEDVTKFSDYFGFRKTDYLTFNTFEETFTFLDECAKTGSYKDEEIEGFVIRAFKNVNNDDYMFKYKFEEPYLLYRQFREITKSYITNGYDKLKFGAHKLLCMQYLKYIIPILDKDPQLKTDYLNNKGVIELRKKYLESVGQNGMAMINEETSIDAIREEMKDLKFGDEPTRYALVTVATIGCGKTTTSLTLCNLFSNWGIIQNDNILPPTKDKLVAGALELMIDKPVVILDKNNHKFVERKQIFDDFQNLNTIIPDKKLKFVCLNFVDDSHDENLWNITENRILSRGDNHQSIRLSEGTHKATMIMKGFINRFQKLNTSRDPDNKFDLVIDLSVSEENSSLKNAKKIINELHSYDPIAFPRIPSDEEFETAFGQALTFKPTVRKVIKDSSSKKTPKPTYYGIEISPENDLPFLIDQLFEESPQSDISFWDSLKKNERIQERFHVTLIHVASRKTDPGSWNKYNGTIFKNDLIELSKNDTNLRGKDFSLPCTKATADVSLIRLCWNNRLMCFEVKVSNIKDGEGKSLDIEPKNGYTHITIGTANESIKAVESGTLLSELHDFGSVEGGSPIRTLEMVFPIVLEELPIHVFF
ncbi:hypothetical protein B5S31_g2718 [[Candida] boidinii]|nr:hypothetical protein B5S31_g2718 [[Candida] boidinii]